MSSSLGNYMVRSPYVAQPEIRPQDALSLMKELDFRHLPVVEEGRLVGIVSERDLREAIQMPQSKLLRLSDLMKTNVYWTYRDAPLKEVVTEMADRKFGSAIVLNGRKEVIGIFTTIDAMRVLADLLDEEDVTEFLLKDDLYESWEDLDRMSLGS